MFLCFHIYFFKKEKGHFKREFYEPGVKSGKVPQSNQEYYQWAVGKNSGANRNPDEGVLAIQMQPNAACLMARVTENPFSTFLHPPTLHTFVFADSLSPSLPLSRPPPSSLQCACRRN